MKALSLVTDLLGRALLLQGLGLGGRPVLVGAAYVDRVVPPQPAVPREHVGAEHACKSRPKSKPSGVKNGGEQRELEATELGEVAQ